MTITESMSALLSKDRTAADLFYSRFLDRYPDVGRYFARVNLGEQAVILTMALRVLTEFYVNRYPAMAEYLKILGRKHSLWGIPPDLYSDFRDCLLDTLEEFFGGGWSSDLESEWTAAIHLASEVMLQGYDRSVDDSSSQAVR